MENEKAIEIFNKWMDCKDAYQADPSCDGNCFSCEYYASAEEEKEAMVLAISALEKQEQANTQNINSMRTSRPNALESLNILEQAKDDKGNVPMSLVRQAFRNVLEQDKWISCKERLPEEYGEYRITWKESGSDKTFIADSEFEPSLEWDDKHDRFKGEWLLDDYIKAYPDVEVIAWKPIEEPYTEEES